MRSRRRLLANFALPLLAACDTPRHRPPGTALPPPRAEAPSDRPPLPSDVTDDYLAERRASRATSDPAPGGDSQRIGTDMMTAPIPADRLRPQR
jgi:hypothetical protein